MLACYVAPLGRLTASIHTLCSRLLCVPPPRCRWTRWTTPRCWASSRLEETTTCEAAAQQACGPSCNLAGCTTPAVPSQASQPSVRRLDGGTRGIDTPKFQIGSGCALEGALPAPVALTHFIQPSSRSHSTPSALVRSPP